MGIFKLILKMEENEVDDSMNDNSDNNKDIEEVKSEINTRECEEKKGRQSQHTRP
jgi:hypothetical protein